MYKVGGEDKGSPLSLDSELLLYVAQKVTKVNMEEPSILSQHDVIIVAISNPKNIGGNTEGGARERKPFDSLRHILKDRVLLLEPVSENTFLPYRCHTDFDLNFAQGGSICQGIGMKAVEMDDGIKIKGGEPYLAQTQ